MRPIPLKSAFAAALIVACALTHELACGGDALAQDDDSGGWSSSETESAPIAQIDADGLGVAVEQESDSNFLITIDLQGAQLPDGKRPQVFTIANPTRLVIDLAGLQSGNGVSKPEQSEIVSALRLGAHAEKVRLVVDLTTDEVPTYRVKREGSFVLVRFSVAPGELPPAFEEGEEIEPVKAQETMDEKSVAVSEAVEKPARSESTPSLVAPDPVEVVAPPTGAAKPTSPSAEAVDSTVLAANDGKPPVPEPISADQLGASVPVGTAETTPSDAKTGEETAIPVPADGKTVVRGIYYQTTSNSQVPAVVFDASGLATYSLNKQKADVYELILKNSSLGGRHLTLPQFPPDSFQGFNVIVARQQGNDVVIKVYVESNVKLFPFIAKQQLWLKASR